MKYLVLFLMLVSLASAQTVINAITAPANASGLCWDGSALWCGTYGGSANQYLYRIDPANGNILKTITWRPANWSSGSCYGLAFDTINNGSLWISSQCSGPDTILLIDTITGARLRTLKAHKEYMAGLANDGHNLWHCLYYSPDGRVYGLNKMTGIPFDSFDTPQIPQPWGATWDGNYLWVCNDSGSSSGYQSTSSAYKINLNTHQIVDSMKSPNIHPRGLAWDGQYLWIVANGPSTTGKVAYQIDLAGSGTPDIQISPTSYNYGNVVINTSPGLGISVTNVGTDTLTIDTVFSTNPVFLPSQTYSHILAPGAFTAIATDFTPPAFGFYTGSVGIVSDDPDEETVYCALKGQGVYASPTLAANVNSYNFSDVRVNCVKDFFLRIVNQGLPTLTIDSIKCSDPRFFGGITSFPISLNCLETTYVQVITRPNATGPYWGFMKFYCNSMPTPDTIDFVVNGIPNISTGGQLLWSYSFPDNVVCVAPIIDINNDSVIDIAAECYGTNMTGKKHLNTYWGNGSGQGVVQWGIGDNDFTGGYGDDCLMQGDDYNNDGKLDILLGTAWGDRSIYAINSLNGQIIWYYDTHLYDGEGGWVYSVKPMPDITGDGIGEVLAGVGGNQTAGGGPRSMYCFSGANGSIIWQFRALDAIGTVNWIPDVNGDGVIDAICGAWGNSYDKRVYCVSGASSGLTTSYLWSYQCGQDVQSVITIPDINGDGKLEVVAGSWNGIVYCFSGANGNVLWTSSVGGWVVKVVAIPDLIGPHQPGIAVANVNNVSFFNVLNGTNGNIYWSYPTGSNVWTVDAIEDLNGDNKRDVICGNQTPGTVFCLSGANGNLIWSYAENKLIYSVRAVLDISGDGRQDVLVGTQGSVTGTGHVLLICGGNYPPAVNEPSVQGSISKGKFSVCPRLSRTNFHISWTNLTVDKIAIYDASGRIVKSYVDELMKSEVNTIAWNGCDEHNRQVADGIYFIKAEGDNYKQIEKIVVVK